LLRTGRSAPRFVGTTPPDLAALRKALTRCAHITRKAAEKRIKTDRLDAVLLARESRAGNPLKVAMPEERDEAIRDLYRTLEDARAARHRARLSIAKPSRTPTSGSSGSRKPFVSNVCSGV
jgi:hypothetical protein